MLTILNQEMMLFQPHFEAYSLLTNCPSDQPQTLATGTAVQQEEVIRVCVISSYLFVVLVLVVGLAALEVLCVLGPELLVEGAGDQAPLEQHLHRPRVATLLRRALDLKVKVVAPVLQLGTK